MRDITYTIKLEDGEAKAKVREFDASLVGAGSSADTATKSIDQYESKVQAAARAQTTGTSAIENYEKAAMRGATAVSTLESAVIGLSAAVSVGAVINFAKDILESADALVKMSDKTGISTQWLQKFQVAGDDAGNTVDEMVSAITQMENRLADGDKSAVGALDKLGLSLDYIHGLNPEQQFVAISDAIRKIQDPSEQVNIAMDLLGRQGANVLPTLKRGFDDVKNSVVGMADETVHRLDEAGDRIAKWKREGTNALTQAIVDTVDALNPFATTLDRYSDQVERNAKATVKHLEEETAATKAQADAAYEYSKRLTQMNGPQISAIELEKRNEEAHRASAAATQKHADEIDKLNDKIVRLEGSTQGITQQTLAFTHTSEGDLPVLRERAKLLEALAKQIEFVTDDAVALRAMGQSIDSIPKGLADNTKEMLDGVRAQTKDFDSLFVGPIDQAQGKVETFGQSLDTLANGFVQLAQVSGDSWGGVTKDIAQVVVGLESGVKAFENFKQNGMDAAGVTAALINGAAMVNAATTGAPNKKIGVAEGAASGAAAGVPFAVVTGGASIAIGAGIGAIAGYFKGQQAEKKVNDLRDAFIDAAGGLAMLNEHAHEVGLTLNALLDAKNPQAFNAAIGELNGTFQQQAALAANANAQFGPSRHELEGLASAAAQTYSYMLKDGTYTADQLSAAFTASQEAQAKAIGINTDATKKQLADMQSGLEALMQRRDALWQNIAQEAPEEVMGVIEAGQRAQLSVLDDQVADQQRRMEEAANNAADALSSALAGVHADPVHVQVVYDFPDINGPRVFESPEGASSGGYVNAHAIQHFAGGGQVLPFRPRGIDTVPAMLAPGEGVLNRGAMHRLGREGLSALNRGGGMGPATVNNVTVSVDGDINSEAARRKLAKTVIGVLDQEYRQGRKLSAR